MGMKTINVIRCIVICLCWIGCLPSISNNLSIQFWRQNYSDKSLQEICSFNNITVERFGNNAIEVFMPEIEASDCIDNIVPYFGGGIDYAVILRDEKEILRVKAKAPYSSYIDSYYPVQYPYLGAYKNQNGQLINEGKITVFFEEDSTADYWLNTLR